jgi:hypothetical protein
MIIDITEKPTNHCWVVRLDAFKVNFNSQEEAQAFVGLLKARIEAPHVWPGVDCQVSHTRRTPGRQTAYANGKRVCAAPVE